VSQHLFKRYSPDGAHCITLGQLDAVANIRRTFNRELRPDPGPPSGNPKTPTVPSAFDHAHEHLAMARVMRQGIEKSGVFPPICTAISLRNRLTPWFFMNGAHGQASTGGKVMDDRRGFRVSSSIGNRDSPVLGIVPGPVRAWCRVDGAACIAGDGTHRPTVALTSASKSVSGQTRPILLRRQLGQLRGQDRSGVGLV